MNGINLDLWVNFYIRHREHEMPRTSQVLKKEDSFFFNVMQIKQKNAKFILFRVTKEH